MRTQAEGEIRAVKPTLPPAKLIKADNIFDYNSNLRIKGEKKKTMSAAEF